MVFSGGGIGSGEFDLSHFNQETLLQAGLLSIVRSKIGILRKSLKGVLLIFYLNMPIQYDVQTALKEKMGH